VSKKLEPLRKQTNANLGQKLLRAARLFNEKTIRRIQEKGHPMREAHTRLLPHLNFEGSRLTDVAKGAGITKQSAQRVVDELVAEGYLKKVDDPEDGRAKMIMYTARGQRGVMDGLAVLSEIEATLTEALGSRKMKGLDRALDALLAVMDD
jgi:DNA-binding MarR family transcriptional regulator